MRTSASTWCLSFSHNSVKGRPCIGAVGEGETEFADVGEHFVADGVERLIAGVSLTATS